MINQETQEKLQQNFVLAVALEEGRFELYVTEPKIFYDDYQEASKVRMALIEKEELTQEQIQIQSIWKLK